MKPLSLSLLAASILTATPAMAADVIDQNAPVNTSAVARFTQSGLAESFEQAASNVSGAGIYLMPTYGSGSGTITIDLWTMLPNQAGATRLATGSALAAGPGQWVDVFWNPVSVIAGATYYLAFSSTNSSLAIAGDYNTYARGQAYAGGYQSFPTLDYAFRTYASDGASGAVPEPATWAMMMLGFGAVGGAMRYRRRAAKVAFA